jgi:uncharacterized membrane protein YhiD involved in acid resistance
MFELFSDGPVYEYPQLINVTYSFLWAFVLASIIAVTHKLTFTGDYYPKNFFQALVLGAVVTAMVMMAIGDSLARGLGVFGAMAIIRFRTRIDDPRDVLFLFAALSTGLAIGVFGYTISFAGTILFCAVAFLLHYSPFKSYIHQQHLFFTLNDRNNFDQAIQIIKENCQDHRQVNVQSNKENITRYHFSVCLRKEITANDLIESLRKIEGIHQLRVGVHEVVNL